MNSERASCLSTQRITLSYTKQPFLQNEYFFSIIVLLYLIFNSQSYSNHNKSTKVYNLNINTKIHKCLFTRAYLYYNSNYFI